ncbi:MAG: response regulator transcription factor [Dehalococcoidia bacterium]|nr:response regulator transcription factor [Dehalococcoidia bacterium]
MADVLVVEDEDAIREVVGYQLERYGHQVRYASDGVDALRQIQESLPNLVILDLMLPRFAGLDLLRVLREHSQVPVIIISARDTEADRLAGFDLGADDYLTKPFSVRELMARVQVALRHSPPRVEEEPEAPEETLTLAGGSLLLDLGRHEVRKDGRLLDLSPRAFELLTYLARHANQVRSRDQILEAVWGYAYGGDTRTIDVHVHAVRRKIEDEPRTPRHLVTVRQYGYKFVDE